MTRDGARIRIRAELARARDTLASLAMNIEMDGSSLEAARALADVSVRLVALVAVLDERARDEGGRG